MQDFAQGTKIRVTGICMVVQSNTIDIDAQEVPFNILLRSFNDISVIEQPSLLSVRNLIILVRILLVLLFAAGVRGWVMERKVRRQNAEVAYIRRRRRPAHQGRRLDRQCRGRPQHCSQGRQEPQVSLDGPRRQRRFYRLDDADLDHAVNGGSAGCTTPVRPAVRPAVYVAERLRQAASQDGLAAEAWALRARRNG